MSEAPYQRGQMPIDEQSRTFGGFMGVTVVASAITAAGVLLITLVFAAGVGAVTAFVISLILATIAGVALKQGLRYHLLNGISLFFIFLISWGIVAAMS